MFVSCTWLLELWPMEARQSSKAHLLNHSFQSECPQTSHHPTTETLIPIPEMELEVLQQRGNHNQLSGACFN